MLRLEFNPSEISSSQYANYALNTYGSLLRLKEIATGTTSVAAIYTRDFIEFKLPKPPLPEQETIAQALSDADAFIASLDALIEKKRGIKQAAMQQLLTGKLRLTAFRNELGYNKQTPVGLLPKDWDTEALGSLAETSSGTTPARARYGRYFRNGNMALRRFKWVV
jgi:type I restriction enzyme S subunit